MSNPTDTNQASEDELNDKLYDLAVQNLQDTETGERFYALAPKDVIELIRTEKLKLLAEVRERVVGEDTTYEGHTMNWAIEHHNHLRAEQREALAKLEAEL